LQKAGVSATPASIRCPQIMFRSVLRVGLGKYENQKELDKTPTSPTKLAREVLDIKREIGSINFENLSAYRHKAIVAEARVLREILRESAIEHKYSPIMGHKYRYLRLEDAHKLGDYSNADAPISFAVHFRNMRMLLDQKIKSGDISLIELVDYSYEVVMLQSLMNAHKLYIKTGKSLEAQGFVKKDGVFYSGRSKPIVRKGIELGILPMPSSRISSRESIFHLMGNNIMILGISKKPILHFDNILGSSMNFFSHDLSHANSFFSLMGANTHINEYRGALQLNRQLYGEILRILSTKSEEQRIAFYFTWFNVFHEHGGYLDYIANVYYRGKNPNLVASPKKERWEFYTDALAQSILHEKDKGNPYSIKLPEDYAERSYLLKSILQRDLFPVLEEAFSRLEKTVH
jgi:hypothetical protein